MNRSHVNYDASCTCTQQALGKYIMCRVSMHPFMQYDIIQFIYHMVHHTILYHTVIYLSIYIYIYIYVYSQWYMHARFLATRNQLNLSDPDCSCACAYIVAWHVDQSASIWVQMQQVLGLATFDLLCQAVLDSGLAAGLAPMQLCFDPREKRTSGRERKRFESI